MKQVELIGQMKLSANIKGGEGISYEGIWSDLPGSDEKSVDRG